MEPLGAIASAAQLVATINGILRVILKVRDELKGGPQRVRERLQYLDSLIIILRSIQNNVSLQSIEVQSQLEVLRSKVNLLAGCLHKNCDAISKKSLRRVWNAVVSTRDEEVIYKILIAIEHDKNSLILSITAISAEATHYLAYQTTMSAAATERDREILRDESGSLIHPLVQTSSVSGEQLVKRDEVAPQASCTNHHRGTCVCDQSPSYGGTSNPQGPRVQSQNTSGQDNPAIDWTRIAIGRSGGDITLGNIVIGEGATFSRAKIANNQQPLPRDRTFLGNNAVGKNGYFEDQNIGYQPGAWRRNNVTEQRENGSDNDPDPARRHVNIDLRRHDGGSSGRCSC